MFKYKQRDVPCTFFGTWKTNSVLRNRNLRNDDDFHIPFTNKNYLKNLPLYKFPTVWNNLPAYIKTELQEKSFLNKLHDFLLSEVNF